MPLDHPSRSPRVGHDERTDHGHRPLPSSIGRKHRPEPDLDVKPTGRLLEVAEGALGLDHQQHARDRVEREHVDAAALPEVVEADLDARLPARGLETRHNALHEGGMRCIHEPIELLSVPADDELGRRIERLDHSSHRPNRLAPELCALDSRDDLTGHAGLGRQVRLPPSSTTAKGLDGTRQVGPQH